MLQASCFDFSVGEYVTTFQYCSDTYTVFQKYYPHAGYLLQPNYTPPEGQLTDDRCYIYIVRGDKKQSWTQLAMEHSEPNKYDVDCASWVALQPNSLQNGSHNEVYISYLYGKPGMNDLFMSAMVALAMRFSSHSEPCIRTSEGVRSALQTGSLFKYLICDHFYGQLRFSYTPQTISNELTDVLVFTNY